MEDRNVITTHVMGENKDLLGPIEEGKPEWLIYWVRLRNASDAAASTILNMTVANAIKNNPAKALAIIKQAQDDQSKYLSEAMKSSHTSDLLSRICRMTNRDFRCETDEDCAVSAPIALGELRKREKALSTLKEANLISEKKICLDETRKSLKLWQKHQAEKKSKYRKFKDSLRLAVEKKGGLKSLVEKTSIPIQSLSRFFNSNSMPRRITLLKIAEALQLNAVQVATEWAR